MSGATGSDGILAEKWVANFRRGNSAADAWAAGYGAISHSVETQARVFTMAQRLGDCGVDGDGVPLFEILRAADRIACAGMWLVAHETYARNVYTDGRDLAPDDFKPNPEGHMGGAFNMVPAYAGYAAVNAITGQTRSWLMGQGHAVGAIDSLNLLLGNMTLVHRSRYPLTDEGLSRYARDFYLYELDESGKQASPLGSHVNPHTAGGMLEGGYLGFAELLYMHMPLPEERLVVFLSDGAFEEQRGSDWTPRWWRRDDTGLVMPIMINNGRRIDQRSTMSQQGGADWFIEHLRLNNFDPFTFDGRDPAAFAWAIYHMEERLAAEGESVAAGPARYPVHLPYGIAVAPKGAGFFGEGTNLAHNLPLKGNPHRDAIAVHNFNESAKRLWVPMEELKRAIGMFQHHAVSGRPREREHPLANRRVELETVPDLICRPVPEDRRDLSQWTRTSPMHAVDAMFLATVKANPHLRPRVGNPDEMRSNRLLKTLDSLKFRVTDPEPEVPEDVHGSVITALNEEAVASAALANKAGINLIHTYEAFGAKMQGVMRQEIIWANHCKEMGRPEKWLSIPLILTSHAWENAKNELSHQDPAMAESMMGELSDVSRVIFPPDYNTASVAIRSLYQTHGQFWTVVVPKYELVPDLFTIEEATQLLDQGAIRIEWAGHRLADSPELVITAIGSYQLEEVLRASRRLAERDIAHSVVYMVEPGRFRSPRSDGEKAHRASAEVMRELYPGSSQARIFVTHTRPEPILGVLQPLNTGGGSTRGLGFIGKGGTLTATGMLFVNRCTWGHILLESAEMLGLLANSLLTLDEISALCGSLSPHEVIIQTT